MGRAGGIERLYSPMFKKADSVQRMDICLFFVVSLTFRLSVSYLLFPIQKTATTPGPVWLPITVPKNYYRNDDPAQGPVVRWRGHANLLFTNWLNYYVYQATPFRCEDIRHLGDLYEGKNG